MLLTKKIKVDIKNLIHGGFFHILTGNVLNKAISMISSIVVARLVDKADFAYLSYADNIYSYLILFSGLGLSSALLKFCSSTEDMSKNRAYLTYAIKWGGTYEITISLLLCLVISFISIPFPPAKLYIWLLCFYSLFTHLSTTVACYLRTQLLNKEYALQGVMKSAITCILSIILCLFMNTIGLIPARYIAFIVTLIYMFRYVKKTLIGTKVIKLNSEEIKAFWSMALSLIVASAFSGMMPVNEAFLVNNIIKDEVATANFQIAGQLPQLLFLVSGAVTVYYFPIIAKMTDYRKIKKKVVKIGLFNGLLIISLAICGALLTPLIMKILYGEKYIDAIPISYLLWAMRTMNCAIRMVPINMLPAIGKVKFNMCVSILSSVVQIALDYYFLTEVGITGVAYGAIVVYGISAVAYWMYFFHVCKNNYGDER